MAYITLFLPVRINERFQNFSRYFQSVIECASDVSNVEIIAKFDDDQDITEALKMLDEFRAKGLTIKHIQSARGSGYQDISYFYSHLISIADENSKMFMAGSVDLVFTKKGFDKIFIEAANKYDDGIFVIHPGSVRSFINDVLDINFSVQFVECFPVWSKRWIEIMGVFGYNSSNDGYVAMVEYLLAKEYGIDRRIDLSHHRCIRQTDEGAMVTSSYWQGPRRNAMISHMSSQSIAFARQAAKNLALNISGAQSREEFAKFLSDNCLNYTDRAILLSNYRCL